MTSYLRQRSVPRVRALAAAAPRRGEKGQSGAQSDDVRMVEELEDLDLTPDLLIHIQLPNAVAVEDLDRHLVPCQLVLSHCAHTSGSRVKMLLDRWAHESDGEVGGSGRAWTCSRGPRHRRATRSPPSARATLAAQAAV